MKIFGLEKLSLVDFDGYVCATVFTGGCNFKCGFCHNSALVIDYSSLQTIPTEEIVSYLNKRKGVIDGLCITGGEPTLNADLPDFIAEIKRTGALVKLDTNGTNPTMVKELVKENLVDYFAMDIKNDLESYSEIIEVPNYDTAKVKESIDFFLSGLAKYEFRTTLIKEYHKKENIKEIAKLISGAEKYVFQKFTSGENCINADLTEVSLDTVKEFIEIVKPYVKNVKTRGYDL